MTSSETSVSAPLFPGDFRRFRVSVLVHPSLSTGAVTTLVYLISRCGRHKQLQSALRGWRPSSASLPGPSRTITANSSRLAFWFAPARIGLGGQRPTRPSWLRSALFKRKRLNPLALAWGGCENLLAHRPKRQIQIEEEEISRPKEKPWIAKQPGLSDIQKMCEANGTPVRAASAVASYRSAWKSASAWLFILNVSAAESCGIGFHLDHKSAARFLRRTPVRRPLGYWRIHFVCPSRRVGEIALPGSNRITRDKEGFPAEQSHVQTCSPIGCKHRRIFGFFYLSTDFAREQIDVPRFNSAISKSNRNCLSFPKPSWMIQCFCFHVTPHPTENRATL